MLSSEDVSDDDVVGEAGEGFLRVGKAGGSCAGGDITAHGRHGGMRCVGGRVKGCARVVVRRGFRD